MIFFQVLGLLLINLALNEVSNMVDMLASDNWIMLGALGNFLVALVAIFVALYSSNKETINGWFYGPKIEIEKTLFANRQKGVLLWVSRFKIKNIKDKTAKNVTFLIEKLKYWNEAEKEWKSAGSFLPFPLRWTNTNTESRDVFFKRPYYVDLCEVIDDIMKNGQQVPRNIYICTSYDSPRVHGLSDLEKGKNKIKITLYCENHNTIHFYLLIKWQGDFEAPAAEFIGKNTFDSDIE